MAGLVATLTIDADRMAEAAGEGYTTATAVADALVRRGVAFRTAHHIVGSLVAAGRGGGHRPRRGAGRDDRPGARRERGPDGRRPRRGPGHRRRAPRPRPRSTARSRRATSSAARPRPAWRPRSRRRSASASDRDCAADHGPARTIGRHAGSRHHRQGAQGAAPRPSRWRAAAGHGHRPGGRVRLRPRCRRPTSTTSRPGSGAAPTARASSSTSRRSPTRSGSCSGRDAITRVAAECAEDLAADGVVYAEVRMAPELCTEQGLTLDEATGRDPRRLPDRVDAARPRPATRSSMKLLVTAMRQAARSVEVAECAIRWRDAGVVGFDVAGPGEGLPADPLSRRLRDHPPGQLPHHDPRRRVVRAAVDLGGAPVRGRRAARPRRPDRRRHHGPRRRLGRARAAGRVRPRPARAARDVPELERPHRRRRVRSRDHPIDLLRRLRYRVTVNTDNRLMSGVSLSIGVRGARRGVRDRPRRDGVADDQRDEERVRAVRRAAAAHQRGRQAGLRAAPRARSRGSSPR